ncbi:hypothetical protein, partial [Marinobacter xestospongiae]|uniref:hypothetical protein n=1 Tax=Marinobacter xestospongiae TaxID=994319 RepID=UPI0020053B55
AHDSPPCGDDESELRHLSKIWGPLQVPFSWTPVEPMLIQISPDNYECVGCAPYDPNSEYFKKKNGVVKGME